MKHSQLDAMLAESGLGPVDVEQLTVALGPLAGLAGVTPTPSAGLLALFGEEASDVTDRDQVPRIVPGGRGRGRGRGVVAGAVVLALSGVGATGLSAAANTLPSPWQHHVSDFSRHYLPFDFPQPPVRLPHLARVRHGVKLPGGKAGHRLAERLEMNGDRTSRSLSHARPEPRRATRLIGRHPGRGNLHQD
ncbi:MAG: hypothetical protein ABIR34_10560, partial [Marmoricola sp.]